jgi:hypothetical protein
MSTRIYISVCAAICLGMLPLHETRADGGSRHCEGPWYNPNLIRAVQTELASKGYYSGRIDGKYGPKTSDAITRWAGKHNDGVNDLNGKTVERLLGEKYKLEAGDIVSGC